MEEYLGIEEVAQLLGLSIRSVWYRLAIHGVTKYTRPGSGRKVYINRADVAILPTPAPPLPKSSRVIRYSPVPVEEDEDLDRRVAARLRAWRVERRLKQADVAAAIGRAQNFVSHYEREGRKLSFGVADQICRVLGHTLAELVAAVTADSAETMDASTVPLLER
jgi:excisionase family DNA binding protein